MGKEGVNYAFVKQYKLGTIDHAPVTPLQLVRKNREIVRLAKCMCTGFPTQKKKLIPYRSLIKISRNLLHLSLFKKVK